MKLVENIRLILKFGEIIYKGAIGISLRPQFDK